MTATVNDVHAVLDALADARVGAWLDGGWGVDALLGTQTRVHSDLDLLVDIADLPAVPTALAALGYSLDVDWLPTRAAFATPAGQRVDLHPVTFDSTGTGWQAGAAADGADCPYPAAEFATGRVGGRTVGCLSARLQLVHHSGYLPRPHDRADIFRLAEAFGLALPPAYRRSAPPESGGEHAVQAEQGGAFEPHRLAVDDDERDREDG
ncbi:MAG: amino acid transporter [Actinomycetota bacterium]|nr:amino acid transporter [Actinomycetota bacterium]